MVKERVAVIWVSRRSGIAWNSQEHGAVHLSSQGLCRIWAGREGWATLALVIDCHNRELLGWHLSRGGKNRRPAVP